MIRVLEWLRRCTGCKSDEIDSIRMGASHGTNHDQARGCVDRAESAREVFASLEKTKFTASLRHIARYCFE
jgi:hypothetical protein